MVDYATSGIRGVVFDVNETLSDMAPLADAFETVGAPGSLAKTWFAGVLVLLAMWIYFALKMLLLI